MTAALNFAFAYLLMVDARRARAERAPRKLGAPVAVPAPRPPAQPKAR